MMVQMKQQHSPQSSHAIPVLAHSVPAPHSHQLSPSSKRLRLNLSSSFSSPPHHSYPFDSAIPASLAPSSIHRQHSSGTGQVLESSLFDQSASPLMTVMAYPLPHSDSFTSSSSSSLPSQATSPPDDDYQSLSRKSNSRPSFSSFGQPGFDSLSPSVSSPPLSSPHSYDFSYHPHSHYEDISTPAYQRDNSYLLGLHPSPDHSLDNQHFDFSSPSHNQQSIGSLSRMTSDDVTQSEQQRIDFNTPPSSVSSVSSLGSYPHVVPPSKSQPSSPLSTPPSTPKAAQGSPLPKATKKRSRRAVDDEEKDEKSSVSSGASGHSHSSSSKDRHVNTAVKLITSNDESGDLLMDTKVKQIFYPRPDWPKPHRIRLIEVHDLKTGSKAVYAHGADVGSVVERKSNISRLFGKFTSPDEKLLMNVPGPHNHTVGQESNILTEMGIRRFLDTNKMKGQEHYKQWIITHLVPRLRQGELIDDTPVKREGSHLLNVYGAADSPQSLPSSPQSYTSYSSESYHSSH